jgi:hypothetical protein
MGQRIETRKRKVHLQGRRRSVSITLMVKRISALQ